MTTQDEPAVRAVIDALIDSWNRRDMKSLAALFAGDADFVDVPTVMHFGRDVPSI